MKSLTILDLAVVVLGMFALGLGAGMQKLYWYDVLTGLVVCLSLHSLYKEAK